MPCINNFTNFTLAKSTILLGHFSIKEIAIFALQDKVVLKGCVYFTLLQETRPTTTERFNRF